MPLSSFTSLGDILKDPSRPCFVFGTTPPREGTNDETARQTCQKFLARSAALATDGFIVYDIQDEKGRTETERPFPFRKTLDSAWYASLIPKYSGKQCVVYKSVVEESIESFDNWLQEARYKYKHSAFNIVGAPSSKVVYQGPNMKQAAEHIKQRGDCHFGCVSIPERHMKKGGEPFNMFQKQSWGAEWFITQGVYASEPTIKLINEYGDLCKREGVVPKKMIITFAPCGRPKTMTFIKWLGIHVPKDIEDRIFASSTPVQESVTILSELLISILEHTGGSGVPLGINVESLSIYKEEIDAAHTLFQKLQTTLLNHRGSPWAVQWFCVVQSQELSEKTLNDVNVSRNDRLIANGGSASSSLSLGNGSLPVENKKLLTSSSVQLAETPLQEKPLALEGVTSTESGTKSTTTAITGTFDLFNAQTLIPVVSIALGSCVLGVVLGRWSAKK